ncbi:non-ribosomal peptide synthetase [Myxococcus stipitatus DSM 14675]|uniref:Non-ribosomal peptide synthetase n=1 Tax=Myxococcus stipitatus (strain DSM 14675 / JCM 12634 / Mx s8) TaxID=1278073 RepID=L7U5K3_MYXSD|nr:non-ribosomal peptide synthetase [Myxococcus stipitatus]AGC43388.1 non-ribosomal peptide synthetase [Myxococcus stipitatus DSM 14675]
MKNVEDVYRLSPMQQGILFHTLRAPETGTYVEQIYWTWHGEFQIELLQRAWELVAERHSALRSAFFWEGLPEPVQAVRRKVRLPWALHDWQGTPEADWQPRFEEVLEADRRQGFVLAAAPLLRLYAVKLTPERHLCALSYHHLLMDGWSAPLCLQEVLRLYDACRRGEDAGLEPARPFRDYIAWLDRQDLPRAEHFWRQALQGFTTPNVLGIERAQRPASTKERYGVRSLRLSAELSAQLAVLSRKHQLTLSTLVQGAWALLLSHYSGLADVAFGMVTSGRPPSLPGVEAMLGTFINTVATRVRVPPEAPLIPWLKQLQSEQFAARSHDFTSLVDVHGWSQVPRGRPLFESIIIYENFPTPEGVASVNGRSRVDGFARTEGRTGYPISLVVLPEAVLTLQINYQEGRLAAEAIERMLGHLRTLLHSIAETPDARLQDVGILDAAERGRLLIEWNDTRTALPQEACVHQLFEAQVARTPHAIAARMGAHQRTYAELEARANQVAHFLRARGVGPEVLVGLYLPRSLELLAALLGILKAGGAYVPLDVTSPPERLGKQLHDCGGPLVLTHTTARPGLPAEARAVCLDEVEDLLQAQERSAPEGQVHADNLAYVLFTSGSTGRPKGVMVPHRGVVNYLAWSERAYAADEGAGTLVHSPLSFDLTVTSLFTPWLTGKTVTLVAEGEGGEPLAAALQTERGLSLLKLTPAHLELLSHLLPAAEAEGKTRAFVIGGEALWPRQVQFWKTFAPGTRLINEYGPTETVVGCCTHEVTQPPTEGASLPIGRPISNTRVYVLDDLRRPVPIGLPGELYVGGEGVTRGYLGQPARTAERYVPDPFSQEPGARLYRTGDQVRWLPEGHLEYLGRTDFQLKLRGYRIEPGEIEAILQQDASIQQALVVVREDVPGDKRLVAYLVPTTGAALAPASLRGALREKLPEYMVPSAFVVLEAFPLTPNGKVHREALPAPEATTAPPRTVLVEPGSTEEKLATLFADVLRVPSVGRHDDFFALGGHSLLAVRLMAELERRLGRRLPLAMLHTHSSVERIAAFLDGAEATPASTLVPLQPRGARPPLFLVHPIGGNSLCYLPLSRALGGDQPLHAFEAPGLDGKREPLDSIPRIAATYVELLRERHPQGPYLLGGWSMGGVIAFEMARQLTHAGERVAHLFLFDSWIPALTPPSVPQPPRSEVEVLASLASEFGRMAGKPLSLSATELEPLATPARLALLHQRASDAGVLPPGMGQRELTVVSTVIQAHLRAMFQYHPPRDYPGPISLFRPLKGPRVPPSDPSGGWAELALQPLRLHPIPGDHHTLLTEPHVQVLAALLQSVLGPAHPESHLLSGRTSNP